MGVDEKVTSKKDDMTSRSLVLKKTVTLYPQAKCLHFILKECCHGRHFTHNLHQRAVVSRNLFCHILAGFVIY
jgi:hypothetical protein